MQSYMAQTATMLLRPCPPVCRAQLRRQRWARISQLEVAPCSSRRLGGGRAGAATAAVAAAELDAQHEELLGRLQALDDAALVDWAAANGEELSLAFLSWLAEREAAHADAAAEAAPDGKPSSKPSGGAGCGSRAGARQQGVLWALGSKLMALREGLSPLGMEQLQEELRGAAAARVASSGQSALSSSSSSSNDGSSGAEGGSELAVQSPPALPSLAQQQQQPTALGLGPKGMALLQQQAAALEAVVGVARARSLAAVLGRAPVSSEQALQGAMLGDAAARILEVLLSMPDRAERAAMLPDAFTPPASNSGGGSSSLGEGEGWEDAGYSSGEEEQLYTTPLQLLRALDLYASRLEAGAEAPLQQQRLLPTLDSGGYGTGSAPLAPEQLLQVLDELREDVLSLWEGGAAVGGDDF